MNDSSKAVFLSYASQDAEAARRICDALRSAGIEVWFDQSELRGGDAWDAKIRKQIKDCALFVPIISANTQARLEGYFRLEWKLAAQRTHTMADAKPFLVPVCVDETRDADAHVPEEFRAVQWTRLPRGETGTAFGERVRTLLEGGAATANALPGLLPKPVEHRRRSGLAAAITSAALLIAAFGAWKFWPRPVVATSADTSAASDLARIRQLANLDSATHEDIALARTLATRLTTAHPDDAVAWAWLSLTQTLDYMRGFDMGATTLQEGRRAAERALSVNPKSAEAALAMGMHLVAMLSRGADPSQAEQYLQRASPLGEHELLHFSRAILRREAGDVAASTQEIEAMLARAPGHRLATYVLGQNRMMQDRPAEAAPCFESVAKTTDFLGARALIALSWLELRAHADVPAARRALDRLPVSVRVEPRGVVALWTVAYWERKPALALQALASLPDPFINDHYFFGPKALLAGLAHRQAGNHAAARAAWTEAERLLRQHLQTDPDNLHARTRLAQTLALLGRADEARGELAIAEPSIKTGFRSLARQQHVFVVAATYAELGEVETMLPYLRETITHSFLGRDTAGSFALNPAWDLVRDDPRVQTLWRELASSQPPGPPASVAADPKSIAVLAFENRSSEKDSEFFSDGISEELLNVLAKVPGLRVVGRTSSFQFKGKNTATQEIGKQLNVSHLVVGSVQKIGERARIIASLIRTDSEQQIWSEGFNTDLKDILSAQEKIAGDIASKLSLTLGVTRPARQVNPEAHRLVLEGMHFWSTRRPEDLARAEARFQEALRIDPEYAIAHARLAHCRVSMASFRSGDGSDVSPLIASAREGAERAVELDSSEPIAHSALGWVCFLEGALHEVDPRLQAALRIDPNDAYTHYLRAHLLAETGRLDLALQASERALQNDPLQGQYYHTRAMHLLFAQRPAEALSTIEKAIELRGDFLQSLAVYARALLASGRRDDAVRVARSIRNHPQTAQRGSVDATAIEILARANLRAEALDYFAAISPKVIEGGFMERHILLAFGRYDEALDKPLRYYAFLGRDMYWREVWDPVRNDPRFAQLVERAGRAAYYATARATLARMLAEQPTKK